MECRQGKLEEKGVKNRGARGTPKEIATVKQGEREQVVEKKRKNDRESEREAKGEGSPRGLLA